MSKAQNQIDKKKRELESNLIRIQEELDQSIDDVKENVVQTLSPKEVVKKYPLQVIGLSFIVGLWLGKSSGSGSRKGAINNSVTHSLGRSLKKRITQKAIDSALNFIEEKLSEGKEE